MKLKKTIFLALSSLLALALVPALATASGTITACGTTIASTATGTYTVSSNLSTSSSTINCITVDASNITINLAGFVVKSTASSPAEGIVLASTAFNPTVENGTLHGFSVGIDTSANTSGTTGAITKISGVTVENSTSDGVRIENVALVTNSSFRNNGTSGTAYGLNGINGILVVNSIFCGNLTAATNLVLGTGDNAIYFSPGTSSSSSC